MIPQQAIRNSPVLGASEAHAADGAAGLTSSEAQRRLAEFGPNAMPDAAASLWRAALGKFWAPVPWMLEAAIVVQLVLGEYVEAAVIAVLLIFNAALRILPGRARSGHSGGVEITAGAQRLGTPR